MKSSSTNVLTRTLWEGRNQRVGDKHTIDCEQQRRRAEWPAAGRGSVRRSDDSQSRSVHQLNNKKKLGSAEGRRESGEPTGRMRRS